MGRAPRAPLARCAAARGTTSVDDDRGAGTRAGTRCGGHGAEARGKGQRHGAGPRRGLEAGAQGRGTGHGSSSALGLDVLGVGLLRRRVEHESVLEVRREPRQARLLRAASEALRSATRVVSRGWYISVRGMLQSRTLSELPYISDISESLLTGGLNGLRVETEAFSPGTIVASGVRGGPQSGVGSLLPSPGCSLAWTLTSAIAAPAALRAGGRLASPLATRGWHAARAGARNGFLPATDEGQALRFIWLTTPEPVRGASQTKRRSKRKEGIIT